MGTGRGGMGGAFALATALGDAAGAGDEALATGAALAAIAEADAAAPPAGLGSSQPAPAIATSAKHAGAREDRTARCARVMTARRWDRPL